MERLLEERAQDLKRSSRFTRRRPTPETLAAPPEDARAANGDDAAGARCVDCDTPIRLERVAVVPAAIRCVDCQATHEAIELAQAQE